jgi:hypothetical protein
LNITCKFLCFNHQVHSDIFIALFCGFLLIHQAFRRANGITGNSRWDCIYFALQVKVLFEKLSFDVQKY